jgi:hypothetical protein
VNLPPIPKLMADRPVQGGLAMPWIALELADGTYDLAGCAARRVNLAMFDARCQLCSHPITYRPVFFGTQDQVEDDPIVLDSPPMHADCADYAAAVCPMVHGRLATYRAKESRAHRSDSCNKVGCDCGGWKIVEPEAMAGRAGQAAPRWSRVVCEDYFRMVPDRPRNLVQRLRLGMALPAGLRILAQIPDPVSVEPVPLLT